MARVYGTYACGCKGGIDEKKSDIHFNEKCTLCSLLEEQEEEQEEEHRNSDSQMK